VVVGVSPRGLLIHPRRPIERPELGGINLVVRARSCSPLAGRIAFPFGFLAHVTSSEQVVLSQCELFTVYSGARSVAHWAELLPADSTLRLVRSAGSACDGAGFSATPRLVYLPPFL
jgi:hypothetical protein